MKHLANKNSLFKILTFISITLLTSCAGTRVNTDYKLTTPFYDFKTFSWLEKIQDVQTGAVSNTLLNDRVQTAVEEQLTQKGYKLYLTEKDSDFLVTYNISTEKTLNAPKMSLGIGYGGGAHWGGGIGTGSQVHAYDQEIFVIDMLDPKNKELLWRGILKDRVINRSPQKREKHIQKLIQEILAEFPPEPS